MTDRRFQRWEQDFRKAAKMDRYALLRDHLGRLGLPHKPELLLEGTIHGVRACLAYLTVDGRPSAEFLDMQRYDPSEGVGARYAVTFDLWEKAFARVLTPPGMKMLDFADLYGHPWEAYERCGYTRFWVSRTDGGAIAPAEGARIEREVTDDLRFDYSEEELDIWFDDQTTAGAILVTIQDCE